MGPLVPLEELLKRLDEDLRDSLGEDGLTIAEGALEDASNYVRAYGRDWDPDEGPVPATAKSVALNAAKRYLNNAWGLVQSRAGDETLQWSDIGDKAGSVYLTDQEIKLLERLTHISSGPGVQTYAYGTNLRPRRYASQLGPNAAAGYVPVDGGRPFPMFVGGGPW